MVSIELLFFISLALFFLLIRTLRPRNLQKQRQPPGPPRIPVVGNLFEIGELPHQTLWRLSKKYGPVMLLQLGRVPTVIVSSPETAKHVLRTYDLHCCSRPRLEGTRKLSYNHLDVAFAPFDEYWKEVRKTCVHELFTTKRVLSFQPVRDEEIHKFMNSITQSASLNSSVNLSEKLLSLSTSMICKESFGMNFEGSKIDNERFHKLIPEAFEMLGSFSASDFFPRVGWIVDWLMGLHERRVKCARDLDSFYEEMISLHLHENREGDEDFVDLLLKLEKEQVAFTRNHSKAIIMNILLGGIDTSAITMTWAMTELMRNPRVMKKVQAEIRNQIGDNGRISLEEINKLKYLKMVIKETWRLHPPSVLLIPREVMKEFQINGYTIYPKTRLQVNVWAIGRDPNVWKDAEEFIPERFMDGSIEAKGHNFELLPFGSGRRICPAIYMGTVMVETVLANLLYGFDWKLPEGFRVKDIDMEEAKGLTVYKKKPLELVPLIFDQY